MIQADALKVDWADIAGHRGPVKIVANLPYNIATPLLTGWLLAQPWPPYWTSLTLMFQKEVAQRITAAGERRLWAAVDHLAVAQPGDQDVRHFPARLYAAAQGHLVGGAHHAVGRAAVCP